MVSSFSLSFMMGEPAVSCLAFNFSASVIIKHPFYKINIVPLFEGMRKVGLNPTSETLSSQWLEVRKDLMFRRVLYSSL
jgi:hypothetical protein